MNSGVSIDQIGQRMKAFRLGSGLTPDELADEAGISRAAVYRYEAGQSPKVDVLGKIADRLGVSLATLLGVGVEYIASAVSFFERMRQLEEDADQIRVLFGPISYLLTTDEFDQYLPEILSESIPSDVPNRHRACKEIDLLCGILKARKAMFRRRRPSIMSLVSAAELEQFVRLGMIGAHNPQNADLTVRRSAARWEVEHIITLLREQPIGMQIGIIVDSMPGSSFQIFKQGEQAQVAVSPFRLGAFANIRLGVATISAAPEALDLYSAMTDQLWRRSLKGAEAAEFIRTQILDRNR